MSTTAAQPVTTPVPVQLSAPEFEAFILPHLSMPKRGPKCKLGYYRVFNLMRPLVRFGHTHHLTPVQVLQLRQARKDGVLIRQLMERYRLSKHSVHRHLAPAHPEAEAAAADYTA